MIDIDFILDGRHYSEPVEWRGLEVLATFDNGSIQPNISLEKVTFVNEAANYIIKYFGRSMQGLSTVYSGLPVQIIIKDGTITRTIFDGFIDFKNPSFRVVSPVKVECNLKACDSLNDLEDKLRAITYGYLQSKGLLGASQFATVLTVHRPFDRDLQILNALIMEYVIFMQGRQLIRNVASDLTIPPNVAGLVADTIFLGIAVVQAVKVTGALLDILLPIPHFNKGITYRKALQTSCAFLGYGFNTTIADIDNIYLPSKTDKNGKTKGIPHSQDKEYNCLGMFELCMRRFKAKIAIVNGVVEFHNISSPFWQTMSLYKIPATLQSSEPKVFNIGELKATKVYSFEKDPTDTWTIKNWTGTNVEIITNTNIVTNKKYSLNNGFEEVNFGIALGNYVESLDVSELFDILRGIMNEFSKILENVKSLSKQVFGGTPNAIKQIDNFVIHINNRFAAYSTGVLKVDNKTWNVPKELLPNPGSNSRALLSALTEYNKYHKADSFLPSNPFGQKQLFNDITVPFQFTDFLALLQCSYATTYAGNKRAKVESIRWKIDHDQAIIDYWVNEIYDQSLTEAIIEP